jgi:hypothetical protein
MITNNTNNQHRKMSLDDPKPCYGIIRTRLIGKRVDYNNRPTIAFPEQSSSPESQNKYTLEAMKQRIDKRKN